MLKISIEKRHLHLDRRVPHTTKNFQTKREPPPIFLPYILTIYIYIYTWEENRTDRWSYRGFNYYQESSETTRRGKNCEIRRNNTAKTHHSTHKLPSRDANRCTDIYIYIHTYIYTYIPFDSKFTTTWRNRSFLFFSFFFFLLSQKFNPVTIAACVSRPVVSTHRSLSLVETGPRGLPLDAHHTLVRSFS